MDAFPRLIEATRLRDICRPLIHEYMPEFGETVADALRELHRDGNSAASCAPHLLRTAVESASGFGVLGETFPFGVFHVDQAIKDALDQSEGGETFVDFEFLAEEPLDEGGAYVDEFDEGSIIGGETSLARLLAREDLGLGERGAILVLLDVRKYGVITFADLMHAVHAKACWYVGTMELEQAALDLCRQAPTGALAALTKGRRQLAAKRFGDRLNRQSPERKQRFLETLFGSARLKAFNRMESKDVYLDIMLLDHTMFCDKKEMIAALYEGDSKSEIHRVFDGAEKLRNWCSHPSSVSDVPASDLHELSSLMKEIAALTNALRKAAMQSVGTS